jgi:DNA-binding CsgD family transcriptional regulator
VGTVAAGAHARQSDGGDRAKRPLSLPVLTVRPEITRKLEALSRRELEVLEMVATGAKNAQIADRFVISQNTVKSHVSRILQKLPATNRTEAAFRYIELYGTPSSPDGQPAAADLAFQHTGPITAESAMRATVSDLLREDAVVLKLQNGRDLELPLPEQIGMKRLVALGESCVRTTRKSVRPLAEPLGPHPRIPREPRSPIGGCSCASCSL